MAHEEVHTAIYSSSAGPCSISDEEIGSEGAVWLPSAGAPIEAPLADTRALDGDEDCPTAAQDGCVFDEEGITDEGVVAEALGGSGQPTEGQSGGGRGF